MYYSDSPKQCNLHWHLFLRIPVSSLMRLFSKTHLSWWPFTFDLCWPLYDQTWWTTNIIVILLKWPEDKVYLKRLMLGKTWLIHGVPYFSDLALRNGKVPILVSLTQMSWKTVLIYLIVFGTILVPSCSRGQTLLQSKKLFLSISKLFGWLIHWPPDISIIFIIIFTLCFYKYFPS